MACQLSRLRTMTEPPSKRARVAQESGECVALDLPAWVFDKGRRATELPHACTSAERHSLSRLARSQVAAVWQAVTTLSAEPGSSARGVHAGEDSAFGALLAATGGCAAARRLAAHFLGRFVSRAPAQAENAVRALTSVCEPPDTSTPLATEAVNAAVEVRCIRTSSGGLVRWLTRHLHWVSGPGSSRPLGCCHWRS